MAAHPTDVEEEVVVGLSEILLREAVAKLPLATESAHRDGELSPWWEVSPPELAPIQQQLRDVGVMQAGNSEAVLT